MADHSGMFGTPIGEMAFQDQANQNALTSIKAAEELGKIAMQPSEISLRQAHAQEYLAKASKEAAETKTLNDMALLGRLAAEQGKVLPGDAATKQLNGTASKAEPFERAVTIGSAMGMDIVALSKLAHTAEQIRTGEASAAHRLAQADEQKELATGHRAERVAGWAAAVQANPAMYPQALQEALADKDPVIRENAAKMPPTWTPRTAALVERLRLQGIKAKDQADLKIKDAREKAYEKVAAADVTARNATAKTAGMRYELLKDRHEMIKGLGGTASAETVASQQVTTEAKFRKMEADQYVTAPKVPADVSKIKQNAEYTNPATGAIARAYKRPDGKWGFAEVKAGPAWWKRVGPKTVETIKQERANALRVLRATGGKDDEEDTLSELSTAGE